MRKVRRMKNGVLMSFWMPSALAAEVDRLVEKGLFFNRSEVIRTAVLKLVVEMQLIEKTEKIGVVGYR